MQVIRCLCVVLMAVFIFIAVFTVQPAQAGQTRYMCGDGEWSSNCNTSQGGYKCQDDEVVSSIGGCVGHGGHVWKIQPICGDGIVDTEEGCDSGSENSDTIASRCRTDCTLPVCGDGLVDHYGNYSEECDDWGNNGNSPNSCRSDCTLPVCGDGIFDSAYNEECDDGNNDDLDGCKKDCTTCLQLVGNINIATDTNLCGNVFAVDDYGPEGVLIIQQPGVTLNCEGATLRGTGPVGIYVVQANNATIRNCKVTGFEIGIKIEDSQNVSFMAGGNQLSGNTKAFVLENSQLAIPKAQSVTGSVAGGAAAIKSLPKKDPPQKQTIKGTRTGVAPQSLVKPSGVSSRFKIPVAQPKPGQPFPPRGSKSIGGKVRIGLPSTPTSPIGLKNIPPDPLGPRNMPPDPLETNKMPVDPYDTKKTPAVAPAMQKPISIVR